jgi:alpha-L-fucosidase
MLEQFVRVRAWNGNLLLNVGPMATADLPPVAYERLNEFAGSVKQNGESVFGAKDLPDGETANGPATASKDARYLHAVPTFQETRLELRAAPKPKSVRLLATGQELKFEFAAGIMSADLPVPSRTALVDVVKARLQTTALPAWLRSM